MSVSREREETAEPTQPSGVSPGIRTFLIADVRDYTGYTLRQGDEAAARLTARFAEIASECVKGRDGEVVELRGDEALAVFSSARQALRAALELQRRVSEEGELGFQVGIGLDAGEAVPVAGGFRGAALNLAARLCSLAGPGEVLASDTVANLARRVDGVEYVDRGPTDLKGFADPVRVMQITLTAQQPSPVDALTDPLSGSDGGDEEARRQKLPIGGFLGALPSGSLVARDHELAEVLAAVQVVQGGEGRLVLLAGEPGAGKTRLAQEVTLHLRDSGFLIASGRCYEPEATVPYYPFLDVLAQAFERTPSALRRELPKRWPYLGALLPDQMGVHEVAGGSGQDEQRLFRAVTGFLEALAENVPVALLLDDLHWADSASLKLLLHLARHTRAASIFILGTYRDVEVGRQHPLEGVLRDLQREGLVERVDVRRLPKEGTSALIAAMMAEEDVSEEFTELVHGRTEGNPYFVRQVLRVLVERGDVFRRDGVWDRRSIDEIEVPESVRSVVGQRLARLAEQTQEVLHEASVLGQSFTFEDLQQMTGRAERELEAALDEARSVGMVRETGKDGYAFDHALTQQSLYGELSSRRKRRLHLAAGEAIESLPERRREARTAEIAWHFLHADDERALEWVIRAGDAASTVFAFADAEWQFRTALELARDAGDERVEADVLERLGAVLFGESRFDEAVTVLDAARDHHERAGDRENAFRLLGQMGRVYMRAGRAEEGAGRVSSALEVIDMEGPDAISPRVAAGLYVAMAHLHFASGNTSGVLETADKAIELAGAIENTALLAEAENRRGTALYDRHRYAESIEACSRAVELAEAAGDWETVQAALNNVAIAYWQLGEIRESMRWNDRAMALARQTGDPAKLSFQQLHRAHMLELLGDWKSARELYEAALTSVRGRETSWYTPYPMGALSVHLLGTGDRERGMALMDEALDIAEQHGDHQVQGFQFAPAEQEILDGHPESALERLAALQTTLGALMWYHSAPMAWALIETGRLEEAGSVLAQSRAESMAAGEKEGVCWVAMVEGMLATRERRWEDGARLFEEALALAREMEIPFEEARVLYFYGLMLEAKEEPEPARERLAAALEICRRLGAGQYIGRIESALAGLEGEET